MTIKPATPLPWSAPHLIEDCSCNCTSWCEEGYAGGILSIHVWNGITDICKGGNDCPPHEEAKQNALYVHEAIHAYPKLRKQNKKLIGALGRILATAGQTKQRSASVMICGEIAMSALTSIKESEE